MEIAEKASRQSSGLEKSEEILDQGVQWNQENQLSEKNYQHGLEAMQQYKIVHA